MTRDIILRVVNDGVTTDLDIDTNIPLRVDISSLENDNIGKVFGVGSQTFDLPGTRKNNQFFKNANDVGAIDTPGFYNFIEAYVLLDGDTVLQGKLFLQEVIADDEGYIQYKVQVVDQAIDFKTQLEGKFIADADWSALEHTLSKETITDSWANNLLNGDVFYPLCDFGSDGNIEFPQMPRVMVNGFTGSFLGQGSIDQQLTPMYLQQFQPAISAKRTFDVMFAQAGYNYTSSLVVDNGGPFENLYIMPKSNDELGPVTSGSLEQTMLAGYTASQAFSGIPAQTFQQFTCSFFSEILDPGDNYQTTGPISPRYIAPANGNYTVDMQVRITDISTPTGTISITLELQVFNSSDVRTNIVTVASTGYTSAFPGGTSNFGGTGQFSMTSGSYFVPFIEFYNAGTGAGQSFTIISGSNTFLNMTQAPITYEDSTVRIQDQWDADTKTSDVLEGFIEQFNLVLTPEKGTERTIRVETFDTWMQQGTEVDWTQKYDRSKRTSVKHPISEQNRTIFIGNAEDNDRFSKIAKENDPNLQYGTRQVISDSNIPLGTRKITTYFAPTIMGSMILSGSVTEEGKPTFNLSGNPMIVPHLYKLGNAAQETFTFKPRIGYKLDNINASSAAFGQIYYGEPSNFDTATSYSTLANINTLSTGSVIYNLHFDDQYIDYTSAGGQYQDAESRATTNYDLFWKNYIDGLYDDEARKLTIDAQFNPEEYKDIRLNDIILIKNQRYRINKIKGFNIMYPDVVTVELIKEYPVYNNVTDFVPTPEPTPPPVYTGSLTNGWTFRAETFSNNANVKGLQIGNYSPYVADPDYGVPLSPTTTQIDVVNWTSSINVSIIGGKALLGTGSVSDIGLQSLRFIPGSGFVPDSFVFEITSASFDPATEPPISYITGSGDPFVLQGLLIETGSGLFSTFTGSFWRYPTSSTNPTTIPSAIAQYGEQYFIDATVGLDIEGPIQSLEDGKVYFIEVENRIDV